jgi:hypothetical protein
MMTATTAYLKHAALVHEVADADQTTTCCFCATPAELYSVPHWTDNRVHASCSKHASVIAQIYCVTCLVGVALDRYAEGAAQPQVSNLERHGLVVNQQVLWLQIAVHHAVLVAVC